MKASHLTKTKRVNGMIMGFAVLIVFMAYSGAHAATPAKEQIKQAIQQGLFAASSQIQVEHRLAAEGKEWEDAPQKDSPKFAPKVTVDADAPDFSRLLLKKK